MAQCYQCGSGVEPTDRFCMQCGADYPAQRRVAPENTGATMRAELPAPPPPVPIRAAAPPSPLRTATQVAPPASLAQPPALAELPMQPQPTTPTWLPVEANLPVSQQPSARPPASGALTFQTQLSGAAAPEAPAMSCPNCGSSLPQGSRFCGDCGKPLPTASGTLPTSAAGPSARPPSAILPDPIPPLVVGAPPRPSALSAQPVLPPFRASGWADQPAPDVEILDTTQPPLSERRGASATINPPVWGQAAPNGAPTPGRLSAAPFGAAAQPASWAPGQPQGPGAAGSFQSPFGPPQRVGSAAPLQAPPIGRAAPSQSAFLQAIAAVPPPTASSQSLPRGEVIAMIVAAIVTLAATIGGLLALFLSR